MSNTTPALQLRNIPHFLESLHKRYHKGLSIPPKWLDSAIKNEMHLSVPLSLSIKQNAIEREIEDALYHYNKTLKSEKYPLKKLVESAKHVNFNFTDEEIDANTVEEFYLQLQDQLDENKKGIELPLTDEQFALVELHPSIRRIMYFEGNQELTSSPYFTGAIPQVIFFQWGNLLGIARYTAAHGERMIKGSVLVYFEELRERNLEQCILAYQNKQKALIKPNEENLLIAPAPSLTIVSAPQLIETKPSPLPELSPLPPWK